MNGVGAQRCRRLRRPGVCRRPLSSHALGMRSLGAALSARGAVDANGVVYSFQWDRRERPLWKRSSVPRFALGPSMKRGRRGEDRRRCPSWASRFGHALAGWTLFVLTYYVLPVGPRMAIRQDVSLDWMLPCVPAMAWPYFVGIVSPVALVMLAPLCLLARALKGFAIITASAALLFYMLPTDGAALREQCAGTHSAALSWLHALDRPSHLFPSLHAAFAVYTAAWLCLVKPALRLPAIFMTAIQCVSVCLVKQHFIADVASGALIAMCAYGAVAVPRDARDARLEQ